MSSRAAPPGVTAFTLSVDMIRCDGYGICSWLFPQRIWLDRWGFPVIDDTPITDDDSLATARKACRACPTRALSLMPAPD
jgi:ferredoxin